MRGKFNSGGFMRYRLLFIFLLAISSTAFSQSLEEVLENSRPETRPMTVQYTDKDQLDTLVKSFVEIMPVSPMALPALDRLVAFIRNVLRQIIVGISEIDMGQYKPASGTASPDSGNEPQIEAGQGTDADSSSDHASSGGTTGMEPGETVAGDHSNVETTITAGNGGVTGSAFIKMTEKMTPAQREEAILKEILAGNIPSFLRNLKEVEVSQKLKDGKIHTVKYKVMPDYLAIGNDKDFVRMPMSPLAAQVIAEKFNCILPTTKMVDDIYQRAQTRLLPEPMSGGKYANWQARMTKNEFYSEHQRLVEAQCQKRGHQNGQLVAGHKKDVVISNHLDSHRKNVIIYGWHDARNGGKPIQGYGWSHENTYADYSHGIRLISTQVTVDGQAMNIKDVLADKTLCDLLSKEGPVKNTSARR